MRLVMPLIVAVVLAVVTVHAQSPQGSTVKKLSRAEFDTLGTAPSRLLVIDVRRPDELIAIGGFPVYLSIQAADLAKELAYIPRDRAIVTVSNHAARASRAAELLKKEGFDVVGAIGAQDYEAEGGTLVKIAPPVVKAP